MAGTKQSDNTTRQPCVCVCINKQYFVFIFIITSQAFLGETKLDLKVLTITLFFNLLSNRTFIHWGVKEMIYCWLLARQEIELERNLGYTHFQHYNKFLLNHDD